MSSDLTGKVVLVTAAAGLGLGQAIARRFAAAGATVVVTDIHAGRTSKVAQAIAADHPDVTVVGYQLDVGDRSGIERVIRQISQDVGPIQVLVNNAALNVTRSVASCEPDDWDRMLAVNLSGPWYLAKLVMQMMRLAGGGAIVNIGSYAPDLGIEGPYAVGKGGMNVLTRAVAREGAADGIRAVTVSTGYLPDTKWAMDHPGQVELSEVKALMGSYPDCGEVADIVVFLASDRARHITGEIINVSAGAYMRN